MEAEQEAEQQSLEQMLEEKKATSADYDNQIAVANEKAAQYQELIEQQNAQIQELVAEQQRQAEEARRKAEREEAARQQAAQQSTESSSGNKTNTGGGSGTTNKGENKPSKGDSKPDSKPSKPDNSQSSPSGNSSGSASGQAVVNYATQFVGNPYVWGGTSLTNGADCSGFIMSVYAHFGYSLPHSSAALRSVGRGVSYAEAQPGDIICYEGHVAIYMGGGSIVHASNSAPYPQGGIKISGNAAYKTILAVRRIV